MAGGSAPDWRQFISVHPDICHGKPCFTGTRIMVSTILEFLEDGASLAEMRAGYPTLTKERIRAALGFAREAAENGRFVSLRPPGHALSH